MSAVEQVEYAETEVERVERWRAEELEPEAAFELALRFDVDLHAAVQLLERGCPSDLALQILR
jgi:hypothetical protein